MIVTPQVARRLFENVRTSDGCWVWIGKTNERGYGRINVGGKWLPVHRLMYEWLAYPIPDGLQIDHLCKNTSCCNPAHLEPVTPRENVMRSDGVASINARKEFCKNGHPFDAANTRFAAGRRSCRACGAAAQKRYRERMAS